MFNRHCNTNFIFSVGVCGVLLFINMFLILNMVYTLIIHIEAISSNNVSNFLNSTLSPISFFLLTIVSILFYTTIAYSYSNYSVASDVHKICWIVMAILLVYLGISAATMQIKSCLPNTHFEDTYHEVFYKVRQRWYGDTTSIFTLSWYKYFFMFVVCIISFFATITTDKYMESDPKKELFLTLLGLFSLSMLGLIVSTHLVFIFLFWEALGITSYFLIQHNTQQTDALKSALKAIFFNKISDFLLVISLCILYKHCNVIHIDTQTTSHLIKISVENHDKYIYTSLFLLFYFLAACTKSVQFFSHMWLPNSMRAPAPASALIHSATLVAAGFVILLPLHSLYIIFWSATPFLIVGMVTALFGALCAAYQTDVKKLLAFSTIANCGFMLVLLAAFNVYLFVGYFVLHGLFKSCAFLFASQTIVNQKHAQDNRNFVENVDKNTTFAGASCLFFLAALPITITYSFKHLYTFSSYEDTIYYVLGGLTVIYSAFSIVYAGNYVRTVYLNFVNNFKTTDSILVCDDVWKIHFLNDILYFFTSLVLAVLEFQFIRWYLSYYAFENIESITILNYISASFWWVFVIHAAILWYNMRR